MGGMKASIRGFVFVPGAQSSLSPLLYAMYSVRTRGSYCVQRDVETQRAQGYGYTYDDITTCTGDQVTTEYVTEG
jgi:hypothetical protein